MRLPEIQNPLAWLLAIFLLSTAAPAFAELPSAKPAAREGLTIDPAAVMRPWKGDLDGMTSREEGLRMLVGRMAQIQDEERRLIGLDLHDGLTQLIISANMHLNALNALAATGLDAQAEKELTPSRNLVKQSIEEARKVIAELRPAVVEDFGLEEGLRRYVSEVCEAEKWTYEIVSDTSGIVVPPPVDAAIFRIAQEALTNVRKHANTDRVRVELCVDEHNLNLRVEDWGRGFDADRINRAFSSIIHFLFCGVKNIG